MSFSAWRRPGWSEGLQHQTVCHSSCFLPLSQFNIFCPASCYEAGVQFDLKGAQMWEQVALHNDQLQPESGLCCYWALWVINVCSLCLIPWLCCSTLHCCYRHMDQRHPSLLDLCSVHVSSILDPSSFTHQLGSVGFLGMRQGLLFRV